MAVTYLKKADKSPETGEDKTRAVVADMLREIEAGGEERARAYGVDLDGYTGEINVGCEAIETAGRLVPETLKEDIAFAHARVRDFAERQKESLQPFEMELLPGLTAGQRLIPVTAAGCYVPGGRYAHIASAIMSVTTAKVAGVENVIACSAPRPDEGINPAILYTMDQCGADQVLALGGVQGVAAMALGLFTGSPADILVGPGNRFVAEAKRMLFGQVGIDLFAGPTEILIIADDSADPMLVTEDLVGQCEHGPDSPAWLISTDAALAEDVIARMPDRIAELPGTQRQAAEAAWAHYGEVAVCDTEEDVATLSDAYAPEHLELHTARDNWYMDRLKNYGSAFVGEETTVAFGDKCAGPNHILPTKGAARYTGGLSVHKFIKVVTWQRMNREAAREVGAVAARISRLEGMEAHARTGDRRVEKYGTGTEAATEQQG